MDVMVDRKPPGRQWFGGFWVLEDFENSGRVLVVFFRRTIGRWFGIRINHHRIDVFVDIRIQFGVIEGIEFAEDRRKINFDVVSGRTYFFPELL
jgi:hypothetical protein